MQRELLQDQLAARLMHEIWTGRWPVGSMLPRELELCKSEGVSRFTVRAAMKKLESAGLIRRTAHVGTMVVSTGQAKSLNRELSSMSDLDRLASNNPRRILDIREFVVSRERSGQPRPAHHAPLSRRIPPTATPSTSTCRSIPRTEEPRSRRTASELVCSVPCTQ